MNNNLFMPFSFELMKSYTIIAYNFIFIKFTIIGIKISYLRISENEHLCSESIKNIWLRKLCVVVMTRHCRNHENESSLP